MARLPVLAGAVTALALAAPTASLAAGLHPAPIPARSAVPLGAAVTYACTDPGYAGPAQLACPVAPFDTRYGQTFAANFDHATPENEFKMLWSQPAPGEFDFRAADGLAALARSQGKTLRGHALVYPAANPGWVDTGSWTRETLLEVMRSHISTMVDHFKMSFPGVVPEWDVVNEPFLLSGARDQNVYERIIGSDWIEQAFRAANSADPDALLFLNEFHADTPNARQRAVHQLVSDFVARGVPIDGVGLQAHVGADGSYPTLGELKGVMAQYAALGLRVSVTELDALRPVQGDAILVQRAAYDTVARACQESPNCTGVTVWGVADAYSWRSAAQTADLFTASFARKRSYDLVRCRLGDPKPATGAWAPRDCGPIETVPAGTVAQAPPPASSPAPTFTAQAP